MGRTPTTNILQPAEYVLECAHGHVLAGKKDVHESVCWSLNSDVTETWQLSLCSACDASSGVRLFV